MGLHNRIASALDIRAGEGRLVNLMLLHSFFVGVNRVFLLSASTSLFLTEYGANALPYIYMATAVANGSIGFIYTWLDKRLSFTHLLVANLAFQFVLVAGFWVLFGITEAQWPAVGFMIAIELLWLLTNLEFWTLSARIFNIQQGKRLFGIIGAGDTIASIIGGFSMPLIVGWIGTTNLLIPALVSILASLAVILVIDRVFGDRLSAHHETPALPDTAQPYAAPKKNHYIRLIFIFSCLATVSYYFLDNAFYGLTEVQYPNNDSLTAFLGVYFAFVALAQLIVQTFFNARIINRLGVAACIVLVPVLGTVMLGATAVVAVFAGAATITFVFIGAARLVEYVMRGTLTSSAQMTLYQSLPPSIRVRTEAQVESFIEPITTGITGVLLLIVLDVLKWNALHLIVLSIVIGVIWTGSAVLLGREYPKALLQALSKRRLGSRRFRREDYSIADLMKTPLENRSAGDLLYLLNWVAENNPPALPPLLLRALNHPAPDVRQDSLTRIEVLQYAGARPQLRQMVKAEPDLDVRATAIRVATRLDTDFLANHVSAYLDSDELPLQIAAIIGLIHAGTPKQAAVAEAHLRQLLVSPSAAARMLAVQAVGEGELQPFAQPVLALLNDADMDVRDAAITAAGKLKHGLLWPAVINNLSVEPVRLSAASALSSGDASLLPVLAAHLTTIRGEFEAGITTHRSLAQQLIRLTNRVGSADLITPHLDFPDAAIREHILVELVQMRFHAPEAEPIEARIHAEIRDDLWYLQGVVVMEDDPLLVSMLDFVLNRLRERVLLLCALIYDAGAIERIRVNYRSDSDAQQSYALEMLHVMLPHELRLLIIALLDDDLSAHQGVDALVAILGELVLTREQWLETALTTAAVPAWLKITALYGIRSRGQNEVRQVVENAGSDTSAVVRETAAWVLEDANKHWLGRDKLLLTVEKMLLLKSVNLFSFVPDPVLFEIASIVKDEVVAEGKTIIHKGDLGNFMYVIVYGRVRVHDGDHTIIHLADKDEFGELALLDSEPRNASVTAVEETYLLRLDQNTFYELISDYPDVMRGIIRVLSARLRETTRLATLPRSASPVAQAS